VIAGVFARGVLVIGQPGQDRVMDALKDHRGAEADYLAALAQPIEQEGVQMVKVLNGDVEEEVVAAPYHEHRHHLGQLSDGVLERLDDGSPQRPDLDRDERLYAPVQRFQVDLGVVAADHAAAGEAAHPFQAGGWRDVQSPGQFTVGQPGI
jgi:hypothetical protein